MQNSLITPGDWELKEQGDANEYCIVTTDNIWVAGFRMNGIQTVERQRANGKLMAASKELLEALIQYQKMYEDIQPSGGYQGVYEFGKMIIKKATEQ